MSNADFTRATRTWIPLAAQVLGWRPRTFWRATPVELARALADPAAPEAQVGPDRAWIEKMMEREAIWTTNSKTS